jgi:hypothetical protein
MKIDAFCFQFLVCDWKNCWQGCWTEKEYLEKEKEMDEREQRASEEQEAAQSKEEVSCNLSSNLSHERAISSSSSAGDEPPRPPTSRSRKSRPKDIQTSHTRSISQLPELGPPLSPIKI